MKKYPAPLFIFPACALLLLAGCSRKEASAESAPAGPKGRPPLVYVEAARQEDIAKVLELTGTVEPVRIARLASAAEGPVASLAVREGDAVAADDELMTIGRSEAALATLTAAREDLSKEQEEYGRIEKLVRSGSMSGDALNAAQSRLERARAQVAQAEEHNRDYRVVAPWDGLVSRVSVREGFYVSPRTPLIELFDPKSLVLRFHVPEEASMRVVRGMKIDLTLDAYPERAFEARIRRIYPELEPQTRTRSVEAEFEGEIDLLKGMFARLALSVEQADGAVTVPDAALITTGDGESVVFVVADGAVSRRVVRTGIEHGGRIQILEGVNAGEQIVVTGNENLKHGASVRLPASEKKDGE